jgi:hypothetical protein
MPQELERFSSRWSPGDSSKTQIPFGNDKRRELHLRGIAIKPRICGGAGRPKAKALGYLRSNSNSNGNCNSNCNCNATATARTRGGWSGGSFPP